MGAVLAAGPGAALSHRSAAALWGIRPSDRLEVTAETYGVRPEIDLHTASLRRDEVTTVQAMPVTTVPRTLLDLATVLQPHQVERAVNDAEVRRLTDPLSLADLVARYPRRKGVRTIRAILERLEDGSSMTRSELEARFLGFVHQVGLPRPQTNASLLVGSGWIECDFAWPRRRVIVELDGRASHGTAAAFERDRTRDRRLHAAGWRVVRVTWRQLDQSAAELARDLGNMLD
jgi:uncharacterized protein DUF559